MLLTIYSPIMTLTCILYSTKDVINNIFANNDSNLHSFIPKPSETDKSNDFN